MDLIKEPIVDPNLRFKPKVIKKLPPSKVLDKTKGLVGKSKIGW